MPIVAYLCDSRSDAAVRSNMGPRWYAALVALVMVACSADSEDVLLPDEPTTHFGPATTWSVPPSPGLVSGFFNTAGFASDWSWSTIDLDGDHRPDLVWTADPSHVDTKSVWGGTTSPHWKVFLNTGAGFAPEAITWSVPSSPGLAPGFFNTAGFGSDWSWSTIDLDTDGKPDLVWTADPSQVDTKSVWGGATSPYWKMFVNTGTGFAADATTWAMPASPGIASGFFNTAGFGSNWSWTTVDLDGDRRPDFVWTADPSQADTKSVWRDAAGPYWRVFLGAS